MLILLFFIVFAACVVSIVEVASLVGGSTSFHVEKREVFKESLWALGGAVLLAFSAVGRLFVSTCLRINLDQDECAFAHGLD